MNLGRKISKTLRFVLAFTLALAICFGSFSVTNYKFNANAKAAKVAKLTIFSYANDDIYMRHSFISIKNINKRPLDIFYASVPAGYSKTIGTRGVKDTDLEKYGDGIYTNVEALKVQKHNSYSTRVSLSIKITAAQLDTINKWMRDNNKHGVMYNCAWFATKVWNLVAPSKMKLGCGATPDPNIVSKNIKKISGYKTGASVGKCDLNNIARVKTIEKKKSKIKTVQIIKIPPKNIRAAIYSHVW